MASSSRFTLLPTSYLASQSPDTETTLPSLIATSEYLADDAKEALPYAFDTCTYSQGYLRQSVWSCLDCGEKGVCYGCSITCHGEHKLVELWTKRHFRCDCPTSAISESPESSSSSGPSYSHQKRCKLNLPETQPQDLNEENRYGKTFKGIFCRCGRDYDPETEIEAMVACIACEDWFHESCLNLRPPGAPSKPADDDEDVDDENVLIPSDSYDGLVCAECVQSNEFLRSQAGHAGFMILEPTSSGGFEVVGKQGSTTDEVKTNGVGRNQKSGSADTGDTRKRPPEELANGEGKKPRLEDGSDFENPTGGVINGDHKVEELHSGAPVEMPSKGNRDIFLAHGVRDRLKKSLSPEIAAGLPLPLEDEEIYEPPKDDEPEETIEQVTERVVGSLPRVQAIEALHGYQNMKERLKTMLSTHAQTGQAVSKEDIELFFEQLKDSRRRGT